ncbi:galactokinase [bacterium]|nr:galactokinase [bacterium]
MIITRSPLRITLGGGGTDLPSYYKEHTGFLISAAINQYVFVTLHRAFENGYALRYSKTERVESIDKIEHPLMREAIRYTGVKDPNLDISSFADIPGGTGLGSSGSFTTALLKALYAHQGKFVSPAQLAEDACHIEMDILKEPVGKQDQYIAAYGGLTCFEFLPDGKVNATPLNISRQSLYSLEDNLVMFFTGYSRKASAVLKDQDDRTKQKDSDMLHNLHFVKELGMRSQRALESGDLLEFGKMMHEHWEHKKRRSQGISNPDIDRWYDLARDNGAIGGKLIGAGGGGFLLFYTENKMHLRKTLSDEGLREVRFRFDFDGTRSVISP